MGILNTSINFKAAKEDEENILKLSIFNNQKDFIETIPQCLKEAEEMSYGIPWNPIGIYDNEILIGFAMYGKSRSNDIWLDRFLIDKDFQGHGYGTKVIPVLLEKLRNEFNTDRVYLSVCKENEVAIKLYKKCGFFFIGELDGEDPIMEYDFTI